MIQIVPPGLGSARFDVAESKVRCTLTQLPLDQLI